MLPFPTSILVELQGGGWVFDRIKPLFLQRLCQKLSVFDPKNSLTTLTLKNYLYVDYKSSYNWPTFVSENNFSSFEDVKLVGATISKVGLARSFTSDEKALVLAELAGAKMKNKSVMDIFAEVFESFFRISDSDFCGASCPQAFGIYFLGDQFFRATPSDRHLSFVHELAHQELFLLQLVDRLVESSANESLVFAPYQGRLRPPIGRIHSLWALYRMVQHAELMSCDKRFLNKKFEQTVSSLSDNELTSFGKKLVDTAIAALQA